MLFHWKYLHEATRPARAASGTYVRADRQPDAGAGHGEGHRQAPSRTATPRRRPRPRGSSSPGFSADRRPRAHPEQHRAGGRVHDPRGERQHDEHVDPRAPEGDRRAEDARLLERAGADAGARRGARHRAASAARSASGSRRCCCRQAGSIPGLNGFGAALRALAALLAAMFALSALIGLLSGLHARGQRLSLEHHRDAEAGLTWRCRCPTTSATSPSAGRSRCSPSAASRSSWRCCSS